MLDEIGRVFMVMGRTGVLWDSIHFSTIVRKTKRGGQNIQSADWDLRQQSGRAVVWTIGSGVGPAYLKGVTHGGMAYTYLSSIEIMITFPAVQAVLVWMA